MVFVQYIKAKALSREWRCSWSSAGRRCSNYIWVSNNLIADLSASYIRDCIFISKYDSLVVECNSLNDLNGKGRLLERCSSISLCYKCRTSLKIDMKLLSPICFGFIITVEQTRVIYFPYLLGLFFSWFDNKPWHKWVQFAIINSLVHENGSVILNLYFRLYRIVAWALDANVLPGECHKTSLKRNQH